VLYHWCVFRNCPDVSLPQVYNYDPAVGSASLASSRTNKLLMRRYAVVQQARDADVFGIIVGTLAVGMSDRL
jgi:diphthamide biosynthesis enzyme Dph1/Dph2-like protein